MAAHKGAHDVHVTVATLKAMKRPRELQTARCLLYFVGSDDGTVKIGVTLQPAKRLASLQTGSPRKLRYLALTEGSLWLERFFHNAFESDRLEGEWFARSPKLERAIAYAAKQPLPSSERVDCDD